MSDFMSRQILGIAEKQEGMSGRNVDLIGLYNARYT